MSSEPTCSIHNRPLEFYGNVGLVDHEGGAGEDWRCPLCEADRWRRRAVNAQGQIDYMCSELAAIMGLEIDTPAGTVAMVRSLMELAERLKARELSGAN